MGQIGSFVRHKTAANLFMMLIILAGIISLMRLNTQFFPDFGLDLIRITIPWSGASADDVDRIIVDAIDPELRTVEGLEEARARAFEGQAQFILEFKAGTGMQKALTDVTSVMSRISGLPDEAEDPKITLVERSDNLAKIVISGPYNLTELREYARYIKRHLLSLGIDKVSLQGIPDPEIQVHVDPALLPQHQLNLADISEKIRQNSQDLPAGSTEDAQRYQIRSMGRRDTAAQIRNIAISQNGQGAQVFIKDIAQVHESYKKGGTFLSQKGAAVVEISVQRALSSDALEQADVLQKGLAELSEKLPPALTLKTYDISTDAIQDRINLLVSNGASGLILVIVVLFLFLSTRVAIWVAAGIPIALLGTFCVMFITGQSINMLSLFALIMSLGIIVDDAIVVGEHADYLEKKGLGRVEAAVSGARRMFIPVFCASLTTAATFLPMLLIGGVLGQIMGAIPVVILSVLLASLLECFLILPGHLAHTRQYKIPRKKIGKFTNVLTHLCKNFFYYPLLWQRAFDQSFLKFRRTYFKTALLLALRHKYSVLAIAIASFLLTLGVLGSGQVRFIFFPSPEGNAVYANVEMVSYASQSDTLNMLMHLEETAYQAAQELEEKTDYPATELIEMLLVRFGKGSGRRGAGKQVDPDTLGSVQVQLSDSDQRPVRTKDFIKTWRKLVTVPAGVQQFSLNSGRAGPPGRDVDIRLAGGTTEILKQTAEEIKLLLREYAGVSNIEDNMPPGKPELRVSLTPYGESLGLTTQAIARMFRNNFEGVIAQRLTQGDDELVIRVQLQETARGFDGFYHQQMQLPDGRWVYIGDVIKLSESQSTSRIQREEGQRKITITADLDKGITSTGAIIEALTRDNIETIVDKHNLNLVFSGRAKEQAKTFSDMLLGFMLGIFIIYGVMAWVFESYTRPFVVLAIIPIGFAGAVFGHWIVGYDLTILSILGILGLSGIVVNDSIVLVTTISEKKVTLRQIFNGTSLRLRAVILTSATTIGGLTPLLFETSLQAQFLIPMAVSIVFGLMMSTFMVLFLVPVLMAIQLDLSFSEYQRKKAMSAPASI